MTGAADQGSIVIEAMVAALILALVAGALFEAVGADARLTRATDLRSRATLVAESELAATGHTAPLASGTRAGRDGNLVWQVDTRPADLDGESDIDPVLLVTVRVRADGDARSLVTLRSLRVGP